MVSVQLPVAAAAAAEEKEEERRKKNTHTHRNTYGNACTHRWLAVDNVKTPKYWGGRGRGSRIKGDRGPPSPDGTVEVPGAWLGRLYSLRTTLARVLRPRREDGACRQRAAQFPTGKVAEESIMKYDYE